MTTTSCALRHFAAIILLALATSAQAPVPLEVRGLPDESPVAVTARHDGSMLRIGVELQDGWHLYGRDVGGGKPVAVRIEGGAFAAAGPLETGMDADGLITGRAELRLPLRRVGAGSALEATLSFMVCDALQCLPPVDLELRTPRTGTGQDPAPPCRVLLVAVDDGARTDRIAAFLRERGFVPAVTTYAAVTAEACDAHDVVLADSPTFGQLRGQRVPARSFPKTQSPVVAVGFLGTQLLEAHKIAMACGYI